MADERKTIPPDYHLSIAYTEGLDDPFLPLGHEGNSLSHQIGDREHLVSVQMKQVTGILEQNVAKLELLPQCLYLPTHQFTALQDYCSENKLTGPTVVWTGKTGVRFYLKRETLSELYENHRYHLMSYGKNFVEQFETASHLSFGITKEHQELTKKIEQLASQYQHLTFEYFFSPSNFDKQEHLTKLKQAVIRHEYEHLEQYLQFFVIGAKLEMDLQTLVKNAEVIVIQDYLGTLKYSPEYEHFQFAAKQVSVLVELKAILVELKEEGNLQASIEAILFRFSIFFENLWIDNHSYFKNMIDLFAVHGAYSSQHDIATLMILTKNLDMIGQWKEGMSLNVQKLGEQVVESLEQAINQPDTFVSSFSSEFYKQLDELLQQKVDDLKVAYEQFLKLSGWESVPRRQRLI